MIFTSLTSFAAFLIRTFISGVGSSVDIPTNTIEVLSTITCYGAYIVGTDLLLLFFSCVVFWACVKMTVGLCIFIWKLLPLT